MKNDGHFTRIELCEGSWDISSKCRQHWCHPQAPHPFQYLVLKVLGELVPTLGQGTRETIQVAHTLPGQESRTNKIAVKVFVSQSKLMKVMGVFSACIDCF